MKPKKCPFTDTCQFDEPEAGMCEGNYEECKFYGWNKHKDTIPLPLVCPFMFECYYQAKAKHKSCTFSAEEEYDYRDCEKFSKWFWKTKAGK